MVVGITHTTVTSKLAILFLASKIKAIKAGDKEGEDSLWLRTTQEEMMEKMVPLNYGQNGGQYMDLYEVSRSFTEITRKLQVNRWWTWLGFVVCNIVGKLDGRGYDGQQKYTICDACKPCHSILSTLKPVFRRFRQIRRAYN